MRKIAKTTKGKEEAQKAMTPVVVYFGVALMALLSYTVARIALDGQPHPIHWAAMLVGGVAGYFLGWVWYRWHGDII